MRNTYYCCHYVPEVIEQEVKDMFERKELVRIAKLAIIKSFLTRVNI